MTRQRIIDPNFRLSDPRNKFVVRFPETCAGCGSSGVYASPEPRLPSEGELIVCAACGAIHIVVPDGMRLATQSEIDNYDNQVQE